MRWGRAFVAAPLAGALGVLGAAACGGGGDADVEDVAGFREATEERVGAVDDARFDDYLATRRKICTMDEDTLALTVAMSLDNSQPWIVDDTVRHLCPGRADAVREALEGLPGASLSEYGR